MKPTAHKAVEDQKVSIPAQGAGGGTLPYRQVAGVLNIGPDPLYSLLIHIRLCFNNIERGDILQV